jgi:hypothetical protein
LKPARPRASRGPATLSGRCRPRSLLGTKLTLIEGLALWPVLLRVIGCLPRTDGGARSGRHAGSAGGCGATGGLWPAAAIIARPTHRSTTCRPATEPEGSPRPWTQRSFVTRNLVRGATAPPSAQSRGTITMRPWLCPGRSGPRVRGWWQFRELPAPESLPRWLKLRQNWRELIALLHGSGFSACDLWPAAGLENLESCLEATTIEDRACVPEIGLRAARRGDRAESRCVPESVGASRLGSDVSDQP